MRINFENNPSNNLDFGLNCYTFSRLKSSVFVLLFSEPQQTLKLHAS
jgi:hypothetical protein